MHVDICMHVWECGPGPGAAALGAVRGEMLRPTRTYSVRFVVVGGVGWGGGLTVCVLRSLLGILGNLDQ